MVAFDLLQFVAVAFAVCGLAAVLWQIAVRDPGIIWELLDDTRDFAERPAAPPDEKADEGKPAAGVAPTTTCEKVASEKVAPEKAA